jgi:hypothetical protein
MYVKPGDFSLFECKDSCKAEYLNSQPDFRSDYTWLHGYKRVEGFLSIHPKEAELRVVQYSKMSFEYVHVYKQMYIWYGHCM